MAIDLGEERIHPPNKRDVANRLALWARAKTIRSDQYRLIVHKSGGVEMYDHATPANETMNVAAKNPKVVSELRAKLEAKLAK